MKRYVNPHVTVITVADADVLTLSLGNGTFSLDFDKFRTGVGTESDGNASVVDWGSFS